MSLLLKCQDKNKERELRDMIKEKLMAYCQSLGLDTIGFMPCRRFDELQSFYESRAMQGLQNEFEAQEIEKRINPAHYMSDARTIISIAFPYKGQDETASKNGFSIYTQRGDYHRVVMRYLVEIISYIESLGGKAMGFVDSNTLPERYIACQSGVGFIGKNNMLITKRYGSYVFLAEILTDLEIPCEERLHDGLQRKFEACGNCEICLKVCPSKAIHQEGCNPNICLSYLTQKKELTDEEMDLLKGNVFGCDFCQVKCPYNQEAASSPLAAFKRLDYMDEEISVFAGMNNAFFKEKISGTSCGWRGKNVIKRNALIRMRREGQEITLYKGESPYLNSYIDRLMKNKER